VFEQLLTVFNCSVLCSWSLETGRSRRVRSATDRNYSCVLNFGVQ
jgi:hypothetical protein